MNVISLQENSILLYNKKARTVIEECASNLEVCSNEKIGDLPLKVVSGKTNDPENTFPDVFEVIDSLAFTRFK